MHDDAAPNRPTDLDPRPNPTTLWEFATCDPAELARHGFQVVDDHFVVRRIDDPGHGSHTSA